MDERLLAASWCLLLVTSLQLWLFNVHRQARSSESPDDICQMECLVIAMIVFIVRGVLSDLSAISSSP
jgi:hypothetical protein